MCTQVRKVSCTVHPKNYIHFLCFAMFCCGLVEVDFTISFRVTSSVLGQSSLTAYRSKNLPWGKWFDVSCEYLFTKCCLRDWSRSGGSYGNKTRVICCPALGHPESAARGTSPPDNKSRGCCCRNSRPTVINPDYNMTKQRCMKHIYDKIRPKSRTKSSDVAYLPPLWRHASLLYDGSCSFTHPVVKDQSARGTSSGT